MKLPPDTPVMTPTVSSRRIFLPLALTISGEAVMGLVGRDFVAGTGALAFLLAAEVVAATAAVSETALVYVARHRSLMLSLVVIGIQIGLSFGLSFGLVVLRFGFGLELGLRFRLVGRRREVVAAVSRTAGAACVVGRGVERVERGAEDHAGVPCLGWGFEAACAACWMRIARSVAACSAFS